jgi:UDPglucose--hexose-1-phosphate uridylyltransferase
LLRVIDTWAELHRELIDRYQWVQIFENRGALMGCSNAHPHGQVWAIDHVPGEAEREAVSQREYHRRNGSSLLLDYLDGEQALGQRLICSNEHWSIVVPYWAVWPFETLLIAREPTPDISRLDADQRSALADILQRLLGGYDALFSVPFPYSFGWHSAPQGVSGDHWQLHAHFFPPLLRSATVRKFIVGYEMLAEPQRDVTAEYASEILRRMMGHDNARGPTK